MGTTRGALRTFPYRYDLDGLRGIAIAFVVIFHVFVGRVSGGVDVFLLLSGYFFLGSQLRYASRPDATLNPWWPIWRTLRRLLPALVLVLTVTTALVIWLIPELRQISLGRQIVASLFYFQNWELATQDAAYGAASNTVSPLQHLWSMSVQGQFYLLAIGLGLLVTLAIRRRETRGGKYRTARDLAGPALIAVTVASFLYACALQFIDQPLNYYSTWSRLWELTLGAVLVLYAGRITLAPWAREVCTVLGLFMVLSTGVLMDGAALFPGPAALYPIGGAVLVVLGGGKTAGWLGSRVMRWLGDIAYPLYLWHWPLLILATVFLRQETPGFWLGGAVVLLSLLLADLTHRLVEKPLQQKRRRPVHGEARAADAVTGLRSRPSAQLRAAAGVVVVVVAAGLFTVPGAWQARLTAMSQQTLDRERYPGAMALAGAAVPDVGEFQPDPYDLAGTVSPAWADGCMSGLNDDPRELPPERFEDPEHCVYGDPASDVEVYVVGGSHAEQWMAPLDALGEQYGFRITPLVRQSCPMFVEERDGVWSGDCAEFNRTVLDHLDEADPDLVISNSTRPMVEQGSLVDEVPDSYPTFWRFLAERGIPFLGLRDNPWFLNPDGSGRMVSQCVAETGEVFNEECGAWRDEVYAPADPAAEYLADMPRMASVDTSGWFCPEDFCPAVIGNIYVYRDGNHISDEYALSLVPLLWEQMSPLLGPMLR